MFFMEPGTIGLCTMVASAVHRIGIAGGLSTDPAQQVSPAGKKHLPEKYRGLL